MFMRYRRMSVAPTFVGLLLTYFLMVGYYSPFLFGRANLLTRLLLLTASEVSTLVAGQTP
jgi:hypothetical protein